MKKSIFTTIVAAVLAIFIITGCGGQEAPPETPTPAKAPVAAPAEAPVEAVAEAPVEEHKNDPAEEAHLKKAIENLQAAHAAKDLELFMGMVSNDFAFDGGGKTEFQEGIKSSFAANEAISFEDAKLVIKGEQATVSPFKLVSEAQELVLIFKKENIGWRLSGVSPVMSADSKDPNAPAEPSQWKQY